MLTARQRTDGQTTRNHILSPPIAGVCAVADKRFSMEDEKIVLNEHGHHRPVQMTLQTGGLTGNLGSTSHATNADVTSHSS